MGLSIGLIETKGFVAAVNAADAMCKAADVTIEGSSKVGSGYFTIYVRGEVGAVNVAIESGVEAAKRVGTVISSLVIARPEECIVAEIAQLAKKKAAAKAAKKAQKMALQAGQLAALKAKGGVVLEAKAVELKKPAETKKMVTAPAAKAVKKSEPAKSMLKKPAKKTFSSRAEVPVAKAQAAETSVPVVDKKVEAKPVVTPAAKAVTPQPSSTTTSGNSISAPASSQGIKSTVDSTNIVNKTPDKSL